MSWTKQVKHPSKIVSIGEEVDAVVLKIDKEEQKISLGFRQLEPDPWSTIEYKYPVGCRVAGTVRNITNFGIFLELEEGIDGLVHISDVSWTKRIKHPTEVVKKGDRVDVMVTNIDKENRRISLGMKQMEADPWQQIGDKFQAGQVVKCKVNRPLERGLLVDMDYGFEGFVPLSELDKIEEGKLEDLYKGGEELELKIIEVDGSNRRIALSQKQLKAQPEAGPSPEGTKPPAEPTTVMGDALKAALGTKVESGKAEEPKAESTEVVESKTEETKLLEPKPEAPLLEQDKAEETKLIEAVREEPKDEEVKKEETMPEAGA
jgi:small subunit ribosomal protein S1